MQDYDTAASNYRIAKQDYHNDRKQSLLASANEMHGLCTLISSHGRSGAGYIENAIQWYTSSSEIAKATRAALWCVDAFQSQGLTNNAAVTLKRASERESHRSGGSDLRAALLTEQASYMFLRPSRSGGSQIRKYAFHMIMAGHMYHKCKLHRHGVRCYRSARCVLVNKRWFHAEDHINYDMARYFSGLDQVQEALHYFASSVDFSTTPNPFILGLQQQKDIDDHSATDEKMLMNHQKTLIKYFRAGELQQQPPERQSLFISELRALVDRLHQKPVLVPDLKLPVIADDTVGVSLAVGRTLSSEVASLAWGTVAFAQIPLSSDAAHANNPLFDPVQVRHKAKPENRHAHVGEPVTVTLELFNPLHTTLSVRNLRLLCGLSINGTKPIKAPPSPSSSSSSSSSSISPKVIIKQHLPASEVCPAHTRFAIDVQQHRVKGILLLLIPLRPYAVSLCGEHFKLAFRDDTLANTVYHQPIK